MQQQDLFCFPRQAFNKLNLTTLQGDKRRGINQGLQENELLRKIPLITEYKESIYHLLHPPSSYKQLIMSQSTFPLSFFTCQTLIFPYLKQESTSVCTCIAEKSILEFSTAISAVVIADCTNRKKKKLKFKKIILKNEQKGKKKALTTKNLPGFLTYFYLEIKGWTSKV